MIFLLFILCVDETFAIRIVKRCTLAEFCFFLFTAFATAAAIAFFHGAEYLERNKIEDSTLFYSKWSAVSFCQCNEMLSC